MSYTYRLVTARGSILPASYPLDITASLTGVAPLTRSFSITVQGVPVVTVDTVRTLTQLLTVIWADGQPAKSLTAQDCRDTIISLALQRGDFSRLPTSDVGLPMGRAYVDAGVLRVNMKAPTPTARIRGAGSLTSTPLQRTAGKATISGAGSLRATPTLISTHGQIASGSTTIRAAAAFRSDGARIPGTTSGTGPAASSSFITADFTSVKNYPVSGGLTGQQYVSNTAYGYMSSSLTDNMGMSNDWWANSSFLSQFGVINPGLHLIRPGGTPKQWWNSDLSVNSSRIANMVNNFWRTDPTGTAKVMFLPYWNGDSFPTGGAVSTGDYATACENMARYLLNANMGNGKKFPLFGVCGADEQPHDEGLIASYYNAFIPRVKAVNSNLMCFGPILDWPDMKGFGSSVPALDGYLCNSFGSVQLSADDMATVDTLGYIADWNTASGSNLKYSGFSSGGSDSGCNGAQLVSYPEAMMHCSAMISGLDSAKNMYTGCFWGGAYNGNCGLMDDRGIFPIGYWYAQGVRKIYGPRWNVPTNSTGMRTVAVTPTTSRFGMLVLNIGNGTKNGTVALSHWPVNTSGVGTANMWQMTPSSNGVGRDGTSSTVSVGNTTPGVTSSITFPDPSITIISI